VGGKNITWKEVIRLKSPSDKLGPHWGGGNYLPIVTGEEMGLQKESGACDCPKRPEKSHLEMKTHDEGTIYLTVYYRQEGRTPYKSCDPARKEVCRFITQGGGKEVPNITVTAQRSQYLSVEGGERVQQRKASGSDYIKWITERAVTEVPPSQ